MRKSRHDIFNDRKSALWKLAIAARMKRGSDASNQWLAANLILETPVALSHNLMLFHRRCTGPGPLARNPRSAT